MECEVFISPPSEVSGPRKYVSRPCDAAVFVCDHCDLQARCHELFGERGERCEIVRRREVWLDITDVPDMSEVMVKQVPKEFAWSHVSIRGGDYDCMISALGDVAIELEGPGDGFTAQELLRYFDIRVLRRAEDDGAEDIVLLVHATATLPDIMARLRLRMPDSTITVTCYGMSGESVASFSVPATSIDARLADALAGTLKILRTIRAEAERADIAYNGGHIPIPARCEYAIDTYGPALEQWKGNQ